MLLGPLRNINDVIGIALAIVALVLIYNALTRSK